MGILNIKNIEKALVVGPVYGRSEVIQKIKCISNQYDLVVFNGGLLSPTDNFKFNDALSMMSDVINDSKVIYNISGIDYKLSMDHPDIERWLKAKPNGVNIKFNRGTSLLVVTGGVTPDMKNYNDLEDNLEISFVNKVNGRIWHEIYNGRFGYIISNNMLSSDEPIFFNYSCQIGIEYYSNKTYAQEITEHGIRKTFLV